MCNTADLLLRTHSELILHGTICMSLTYWISSILGQIQVSFARLFLGDLFLQSHRHYYLQKVQYTIFSLVPHPKQLPMADGFGK